MSYKYCVFSIEENDQYKPVIVKFHSRWVDGGVDLIWIKKLENSFITSEVAKLFGVDYFRENYIFSTFDIDENEINLSLEELSKGIDYTLEIEQEFSEFRNKYA